MMDSQKSFAQLQSEYNAMSDADKIAYEATVKSILPAEAMEFAHEQNEVTAIIAETLEIEQLMARLAK